MYLTAISITSFLNGLAILFSFFSASGPEEISLVPEQESAVVIELFTSQGCSSCPAADRLLSELISEAETKDLPVYGLSLHVDYWNRLGWKDPYSDRTHTNRQYAYARKLKSSTVYTPQMVVNGITEFVGSNRARASNAIKNALSTGQKTRITVTHVNQSGNRIKASYSIDEAYDNQILNIALVEKDISTEVKRGENRGRQLRHDNVVRAFEQKVRSNKGAVTLQIPQDLDLDKSSLVLYVQDLDSFEITGATRVALDQMK